MSCAKRAILGALTLGAALGTLVAAPIPVRFAEGAAHAFLLLHSVDGDLLATGDLLQIDRGGAVEKRMVFQFTDGSVLEESVVFTQQGVYAMTSYRMSQRGPAFEEDIDISLERATGKYRVKTKAHKNGKEKLLDGALDELPGDVYNGLLFCVVKDLPEGVSETVHYVAFTPKPRLIQLDLVPAGKHEVLVGTLTKTAVHYRLKPQLGRLRLFAKLIGRLPPDGHVWLVSDDVPAFVRFEGPLYPTGPAWRITVTSPRWPE